MDIIAHITGIITLLCCIAVALFSIKFACNFSMITRVVGAISFMFLAIGYFLYLKFHISPSNYEEFLHAFISILFDMGTSGSCLTFMLGYNDTVNK